MRATVILLAAILCLTVLGATGDEQDRGVLLLKIVDQTPGSVTPARIQVSDQDGKTYIASDAIPVAGDAEDRQAPWHGTLEEALASFHREVRNPFLRTTQFYSSGTSRLSLASGRYTVTAAKGIEFEEQSRAVEIQKGREVQVTIVMPRWINLPVEGWFSSDAHLHINRSVPGLDPILSKWMQAEDVHVANLLQWGHSKGFNNAPQHSFGAAGVYREGDYIVASGQENPRTHVLGHTIILGASSAINFPDHYLLYKLFWQEAGRQGALKGYAHWGVTANALNGLSIDLPLGVIDFLEILQFGAGNYDAWYSILNSGFRLTPTAGSDYPFGGLPGSERVYTKLKGPLTYESWMEGLRMGRTFVTNGPCLEFEVNGRQLGEEVVLNEPGSIRIKGRVRFNAGSDEVKSLEVIENGSLLRSFPRQPGASEISCEFEHRVAEAGWVALRIAGRKTGKLSARASEAHTAPIYLAVKNRPSLAETPRAKALANAWAARLLELEWRLGSQRKTIGLSGWSDGVDLELMEKNRADLLEAVRAARRYFQNRAK